MRVFRLTKWYLDLTTADGAAFIGYAARLSWRGLSVRYGAALLALPGVPVRTDTTVRPGAEPERADGIVRWHAPALRVEAAWHPRTPPFRHRLLDGVDWECVAPAADARVRIGDVELAGSGYVERLHMELPPWELPIEELRWGRFIVADASIVWIDWRGTSPLRLVLRDGIEQPGAIVEDSVAAADGWRLVIEPPERTLREGPILDVLQAVPRLAALAPRRIAGAHETKWLARGRLEGEPERTGAVLHEVVRWPAGAAK